MSIFPTAGSPRDGYIYSQHYPKARFDESVPHIGAAAYAYPAVRWLESHNKIYIFSAAFGRRKNPPADKKRIPAIIFT